MENPKCVEYFKFQKLNLGSTEDINMNEEKNALLIWSFCLLPNKSCWLEMVLEVCRVDSD